jgi:hypothetical protein
MKFQFADTDHPLIGPLRRATIEKSTAEIIPNSIRLFGKEWRLLAHTIIMNKTARYNMTNYASGSDAKLCPFILEKSCGKGRIAVMQIGRWEAGVEAHEQFCRTLAENVLTWASKSI